MLGACASEQQVLLLPRAPATERATGKLDRLRHDMVVVMGGKTYAGKTTLRTAMTTSSGFLGPRTSLTSSDRGTALLIGESGQIRCEFGWDAMMTIATGVCTDSNNLTYDLLIKD